MYSLPSKAIAGASESSVGESERAATTLIGEGGKRRFLLAKMARTRPFESRSS